MAGGCRGSTEPTDSRPATWSCQAAAWLATTPSSVSSSHNPAWNRLIRSSPPGTSCSARASPISLLSACSSGLSSAK